MRSAGNTLLALLLAASCGGALAPSGPRAVAFSEVAATPASAHDGPAAIIVGASAASVSRIGELARVPHPPAGRVLVAVFQGAQRTAGYAIRVDGVERDGDRLVVHATFSEPGPGAAVAQVLTSPAHVVSIAAADAAGVTAVVLLDAAGTERARAAVG